MCGIAGILTTGSAVDEAVVARMSGRLANRGPDDEGTFVEGPIGLGHRRLSIIDLSSAGHQPMMDRSGRYVISFNGEIYNYRELRADLADRGVGFRSNSDTEVLLELFASDGPAAFRRLNGIFAFAIWDRHAATLHLVRDRLGVKPLFFERTGSRLAFGSEIKAIRALEDRSDRICWQAFREYLWFGNPTGDLTFYEGVLELPPGHHGVCHGGELQVAPYWTMPDECPGTVPGRVEDTVARTRELLSAAVARQLVADVPVGVFLSGGVDSSAIVAFAARHSPGRISTYSVGFDDRSNADELPIARRVARHFGTDHHEIVVTGAASSDVLRALVEAHDEPFADAGNIPLYRLCREVRSVVKVVLQGDGGDEAFGGYPRYSWLGRLGRIRALAGVAGRLGKVIPGDLGTRAARLRAALAAPTSAERMALLLTVETRDDPPEALLSDRGRALVDGTDPFKAYKRCAARWGGCAPVDTMLRTDRSVLLPSTFLEKVDRASMAHGVEVRVPLLDDELIEHVSAIPGTMLLPGGRMKGLLKQALRGTVPDWVLDRPKTGFGVPYGRWLRGPLQKDLRDAVSAARFRRAALFDQPRLDRMMDDHAAGRANRGFMLWKVLQFALWLEVQRIDVG